MFGKINFFNRERGFGFVRPAPDAEDIFFHISEFEGKQSLLVKGANVEFTLGTNRGRQVAREIRLVAGTVKDVADGEGGGE